MASRPVPFDTDIVMEWFLYEDRSRRIKEDLFACGGRVSITQLGNCSQWHGRFDKKDNEITLQMDYSYCLFWEEAIFQRTVINTWEAILPTRCKMKYTAKLTKMGELQWMASTETWTMIPVS